MLFLKRLFGGAEKAQEKGANKPKDAEIEYNSFTIRADRFSGGDAVLMIHIKTRQIIDEQGERIFISTS